MGGKAVRRRPDTSSRAPSHTDARVAVGTAVQPASASVLRTA